MSASEAGSVSRSILHVDMDAFFAAVEVLDQPRLRGRPVIVGGTAEGHGVVSTANYEARKFGVHSAMPAATAVRLCPQGIFLRPRIERYVAVSRQVFEIFERYTPLVEPLSIDEAFLDVTGSHTLGDSRSPVGSEARPRFSEDPAAIAEEIRRAVAHETGGLTCSVGVAPNKFLAKLASDLEKPDGLVVTPREAAEIEAFLAPLPIRRLWGVGPKSAEVLLRHRLETVGDLQRLDESALQALVGEESGAHLWRLVRGLDRRSVSTGREAKSVSQERTYGEFIASSDRDRIERELFSLAEEVAGRLRRSALCARTVHLKVRDERFSTRTRAASLETPTCLVEEIFTTALRLFDERVELEGRAIRLLGVGTSGLSDGGMRQLDLFAGPEWKRQEAIARAAEAVEEKLGRGSITRGRLIRRRDSSDDAPPR